MKITALVKYTPELTGERRFAADFTLDREAVAGQLSELDEHTAEQAIRLAETSGAELTYLTMGPPKASDALRKALSMGGDRAVHVQDPALHGSDANATSLVLAAAVKATEPDIVVCGMASTDAGMGAVPSMLAERLGLAMLGLASSVTLDGTVLRVERETQTATESVEADLPALVSVTDRTGEARYPSFKGIMAAKKKPVETWSLADLGIDPGAVGLAAARTRVRAVTPRPPRTAGQIVKDEGDGGLALAGFLTEGRFI